MPLDDKAHAPTTATATPVDVQAVSPIDNEIPAYRAISPGAIISLILGALSFFCYSSLNFLVVAVAAVLIGALSLRKIQRMPDILTGQKMAQVGVILGLVFGLTSATIAGVQTAMKMSQAKKFARQFEDVMTKGSIEDCIWYSQHPERRKDLTPKKLLSDMKASGPQTAQMAEMELLPLRGLKTNLDEPGAQFHFRQIEGIGESSTELEAYALYDVHLPNRKTPGDKDSFALAIIHQVKRDRKLEWYVEKIQFPYKPSSYVAPQKPVDDGHGEGAAHTH